jgi:hypothetical protein
MPREYEEPVVTREKMGSRDEYKITHPAYAQISASHVTGGACLYGSDFQHQHYVCISIARSEMNRHLSNDWPHAGEEIIEVALSESQWASFVSSVNRGQGVQCTLQHINRKQVPQIAMPESKLKDFRIEGKEAAQETLNRMMQIIAEIQASRLSQKEKDRISKELLNVRDRMKDNLKFVLEQFGEHMEATVQKARTEISTYAQAILVRTGLSKLIGNDKAAKFLGYEEREDQ